MADEFTQLIESLKAPEESARARALQVVRRELLRAALSKYSLPSSRVDEQSFRRESREFPLQRLERHRSIPELTLRTVEEIQSEDFRKKMLLRELTRIEQGR